MIKVKCLPPFRELYKLDSDTNLVICIGGRGGAKTYGISQFVSIESTIKKKRCVILRDEHSLIRESILNEIFMRYDTANKYGHLDTECEKLSTGIKCKKTNEMLVFTKGFRASDNQKKANMKSISDIDIAVIEEAEDIRDSSKFNTFSDSIRKKGSLIIVILNTPDINHWIIKRYFKLKQIEDGYFDIEPKNIKGFKCIKTSFLDNPYLTDNKVSDYKGYGDPNHHLYDKHYYLTAILGYASTGRRGQILTKVKHISLSDYMNLPFKEFYGQDFGTSSPAGMVGVKFDKNNCYVRQINYKPMHILEIAKLYCELKLNDNDRIICDCAEPNSISKLKKGFNKEELTEDLINNYKQLMYGFHVIPCVKGTDSIINGISTMVSLNLHAVTESSDLWNEIMNYCYAQDKNGNYTDMPIDGFNHLIDSWRYVVQDQRTKNNSNKVKMFG